VEAVEFAEGTVVKFTVCLAFFLASHVELDKLARLVTVAVTHKKIRAVSESLALEPREVSKEEKEGEHDWREASPSLDYVSLNYVWEASPSLDYVWET